MEQVSPLQAGDGIMGGGGGWTWTGGGAWAYHEAVGEDLDAGVAEGGGGELEVAEVAGEDLRGHGHEVVDHVHDHRRRRQARQQAQLDGARRPRAPRPRRRRVRQDALQPAPGPAVRVVVAAGHGRTLLLACLGAAGWVGKGKKAAGIGGGAGRRAAGEFIVASPPRALECWQPQPNGNQQ